ncbi:questin oxidase family protein [Polymorphospora sp. 2-325]|uniref:Questin oxidase family protein n=1 Tax=Polymorphospora lycopeni TaxID=3140240 RepID=A0ABV5CM98_9ACTN
MTTPILDQAYDRLRHTGPERTGWLSNHAPMAVECLTRHGHGDDVHRWLDGYADRLEERPRGIDPITADEWRDPLGDPVRTGDWLDHFERELAGEPWRDVLARWWPRLLPGIAAGATHGVIRVGHAVRALLDAETAPRVTELGHGLAYWAARWQPLAAPGAGRYPSTDPRSALDAVPRAPDQRHGIRARLAQLANLPGWPAAAGAVPGRPGRAGTGPARRRRGRGGRPVRRSRVRRTGHACARRDRAERGATYSAGPARRALGAEPRRCLGRDGRRHRRVRAGRRPPRPGTAGRDRGP